MRVYLSQIREWVVDFSADMLFISLRTDVAWYRLSKYASPFLLFYISSRFRCSLQTRVLVHFELQLQLCMPLRCCLLRPVSGQCLSSV